MGDRPKPRHRCGKPLLRNSGHARRARHLDLGRPRAVLKTHELSGDRDKRPDHWMGFTDAIPAIPGPTSTGGLHPSGRWRQHGGVLALAFASLWSGDLLEGHTFPRSRAKPYLRRTVTCC